MKNNKAFTLIELAIVIVIIGLLVGSVMAGRELIMQSTLNKVMTTLDNYRRAANTFRAKYNALPGDFNRAELIWGTAATGTACSSTIGTGTQTCNGDNDGTIDYETGGSPAYESIRAWQHLSNAGLISGNYNGVLYADCPTGSSGTNYRCYHAGVDAPTGPNENSAWQFIYVRTSNVWAGLPERHVFIYSSLTPDDSLTNDFTNRAANPVLTTEEQYRIDLKIDDGKPFAGKIIDSGKHTASDYSKHCATTNVVGDTTATYDLTYKKPACVLIANY